VFAVEMQDGQPTGMRRHLLRAKAGQVNFWNECWNVWRPTVGEWRRWHPTAQVEASQAQGAGARPCPCGGCGVAPRSLGERLVGGDSTGALSREHAILEFGQELAVERGVAMPQKGNVWVKHLAGDSCFMAGENCV